MQADVASMYLLSPLPRPRRAYLAGNLPPRASRAEEPT